MLKDLITSPAVLTGFFILVGNEYVSRKRRIERLESKVDGVAQEVQDMKTCVRVLTIRQDRLGWHIAIADELLKDC